MSSREIASRGDGALRSGAAQLPDVLERILDKGIVVAGRLEPALLRDERSVDGRHPIRLVPVGALAAIVSDVPAEEFDEERLPARLNNLTWLEPTAHAHEDILERALATTGVVPFRFCTI